MKYDMRHFDQMEANEFFSRIADGDVTPVIDLSTGAVGTCGAVARMLPPQGGCDYLVPDADSIEEAEAWWNGLRRIDYEDAEYVLVDDEALVADDTYRGVCVNLMDKKLYRLIWCMQPELTVPFSDPEFARLMLDKIPVCDWNKPIGVEGVRDSCGGTQR